MPRSRRSRVASGTWWAAAVGVLLAAVAGCSSGESPDGATEEPAVEVFGSDLSSGEPLCDGLPTAARTYRSTDASFAWLDLDVDGTVDAINAEGDLYLRAPDQNVPAPARWVTVPADAASPVTRFASGLRPWSGMNALADISEDPLHEFQVRQDAGDESPAPVFDDDPDWTMEWRTDPDGRVIEGSYPGFGSVELLSSADVPPAPEVPDDAQPLQDEPVSTYLPLMVTLDPTCGSYRESDLPAIIACTTEVVGEETVGQWVNARPQRFFDLPPQCTS